MITIILMAVPITMFLIWWYSAPQTLAQKLKAEGVTVASISNHQEGSPVPDAQKLYDAFCRGRARVEKVYPQAKDIKMAALSLFQTTQIWHDGESFPRNPAGSMAYTEFGITCYAFEECIEHETVHLLVQLCDPLKPRTQAAIDNPKDADQKAAQYTFFWQIGCHNTSDDVFGDGTSLSSSGRASCVLPYSGPPKT